MSGKASMESMESMEQLLRTLKDAQDGVINRLNATYQTIGSEWSDKHYMELGEVVSRVSKGINSANNEIEEAVQRLQHLKRALEDYLNA